MGLATDAFGFDVPSGGGRLGRTLVRMLLLDQFIAVPVALVMASAGLPFVSSLIVASVYSHVIGSICAGSSMALLRPIDALPPVRSLAAMMALYFACGVAGAEIARRICSAILGSRVDPEPAYLSWAIGATMALLVGMAIRTIRRLRGRVLATELEALQARINPHFLFNTLNSIAALIRDDPARAEAMTLQLSALFRYTLTAPRRGLVTLEEELTIVEGYLGIEQERLGSRLAYTIEVDPAVRSCRVPPLTLQPLVENAVKHGIAPDVAGGTVRVRAWRDGDAVQVAIVDSGAGGAVHAGTGEGLDNVRRRMRATFGAASAVSLTHQGSGTEARLTFPAREAT